MFTKKRISIACFSIIAIIGSALFFFLYPTKTAERGKVNGYIDKLYSFSGKLTEAEKKSFLETIFALEKIIAELNNPTKIDELIPPADLEALQKHTEELIRENPDLKPPPHGHAQGTGHEAVYQQQQMYQEELTSLNAAIEEVKASDAAEGAKEALLNVLEHRRAVLLDDGKTARKMEKVLAEIMKNEPDVIGLEWGDGGYKRIYAHELIIRKRRIHHPDGTIEEEFRGGDVGSTDPVLGPALIEYVNQLERTPPWEPDPPLPEHKDLRYSIEYEDVYVDETGKRIPNPSPQTPQQSNHLSDEVLTDDISKREVLMDDPSEEALPELPQEDLKPIITKEAVTSWQKSLGALEAAELEEMRPFFERVVGIPLAQFLEMSEAEIEAEFRKQFSISPSDVDIEVKLNEAFEQEVEKRRTASETAPSLPASTRFENSLREKYSSLRFRRAIATLNHLGPEEGLRRLQEVDPEVAADVNRFLQKQEGK